MLSRLTTDRRSVAFVAAILFGPAVLLLVLYLGRAGNGTRGALLAWGGLAAAALTGAAIGVILGQRGWELAKLAGAAAGSIFVTLPVAVVAVFVLGTILGIPACIIHHVFGIGSDSWCDP